MQLIKLMLSLKSRFLNLNWFNYESIGRNPFFFQRTAFNLKRDVPFVDLYYFYMSVYPQQVLLYINTKLYYRALSYSYSSSIPLYEALQTK